MNIDENGSPAIKFCNNVLWLSGLTPCETASYQSQSQWGFSVALTIYKYYNIVFMRCHVVLIKAYDLFVFEYKPHANSWRIPIEWPINRGLTVCKSSAYLFGKA